jgi:hypothetical protein
VADCFDDPANVGVTPDDPDVFGDGIVDGAVGALEDDEATRWMPLPNAVSARVSLLAQPLRLSVGQVVQQ